MTDFFLGQLAALGTFFAFPALQYMLLRRFTARDGAPELWYLPRYGFRVVIRNLPGRYTLSAIRYRALVRREVPGDSPAEAATYVDDLLHQRDDFFLFVGVDQVLVAFRIEGSSPEDLEVVVTELLGAERKRIPLNAIEFLVCDYEATVENFFSFNVRLGKRAMISRENLVSAWQGTQVSTAVARYAMEERRVG